jgi:TonB family protein
MTRLEKKCVVSSMILHGGMVAVVLLGAGFFTQPPPPVEISTIELVIPPNAVLVDDKIVGGGNPNAAPPKPTPRPPQPQPAVQHQQPPPELKPDNPKIVPEDRSVKSKIEPVLTPIKRPAPDEPKESSRMSEKDRRKEEKLRQQQKAELEKELRTAFNNVGKSISEKTSSSTDVDVLGPGGSAFVNYAYYVKETYENAWRTPSQAIRNAPDVEVEVTIARDGTVLSSTIKKKSGIAALDNSVQEALNRVRQVREFPEAAKDAKRTFRIVYSLTQTRTL